MHVKKAAATLVVVASMFASSIHSIAATADAITGAVLVNRGQGFEAVAPGAQLSPGDIVMARDGGAAEVTFSDGCSARVEPGQTLTIGAQSPCASANEQAANEQPANPQPQPGLPTSTLLVGAGLAGAAGLAIALSGGGGSDSKPATVTAASP